MNSSLFVLLISTASIAFVHAFAPDHWMPFAALAKSQKWPKVKLFWITLVSGIGHVGISIILSLAGILLGFGLTRLKSIEGQRGELVLWLLIGFGLAYMLWGIKKAKEKKQEDIESESAKAKMTAMWTMFIIVILGPCEPLIPLMFLGYSYGNIGLISVSIIFSIVTIIMMVAQSLLAFMGIQLIRSDFLERYSHAFAGLVIALTGVFVMVAGI